MHSQLQRALALSQKTGDRLIVVDSQQEDSAFVVMSFGDYEKLALGKKSLVSLTEDELVDKINRDIALWQEEQVVRDDNLPNFGNSSLRISKIESEFGLNREIDYPFWNERKERFGAKLKKKNWQIPPERKEAAEEVIEEDRQYLEEVNY